MTIWLPPAWDPGALGEPLSVSVPRARTADLLVLERGMLRVEVAPQPFEVTGAPERLELSLVLSGGRRARCEVQIAATDRVTLRLSPDGDPLRVALDWRRRADEHMVGLGARHWTQFDQGRDVSFREMG